MRVRAPGAGLAEDFSFAFLGERSAWPMIHVVNPFFFYVTTQCSLTTVVLFFGWESFERLLAVVLRGSYGLFSDQEPIETASDSLIGDVLQGFVGLFLAKLFLVALNAPTTYMGLRKSYRLGLLRMWFKRVLQFLLFFLAYAGGNMYYVVSARSGGGGRVQYGFTDDGAAGETLVPAGPLAAMALHLVLLYAVFRWNASRVEHHLYWSAECRPRVLGGCGYTVLRTGPPPPSPFPWARYTRIHVALTLVVFVMELSAVYNYTSTYLQAWTHGFVVVAALVAYALAQGRGRTRRVADLFTCGAYSLWTRDYRDNAGYRGYNVYRDQYDALDVRR